MIYKGTQSVIPQGIGAIYKGEQVVYEQSYGDTVPLKEWALSDDGILTVTNTYNPVRNKASIKEFGFKITLKAPWRKVEFPHIITSYRSKISETQLRTKGNYNFMFSWDDKRSSALSRIIPQDNVSLRNNVFTFNWNRDGRNQLKANNATIVEIALIQPAK